MAKKPWQKLGLKNKSQNKSDLRLKLDLIGAKPTDKEILEANKVALKYLKEQYGFEP